MDRRHFLAATIIPALAVAGGGADVALGALQVTVGDTLASSTGSWTGSPTSFTYRFQRRKTSGTSWVTVQNGANSRYLVAAGDAGYEIRVQVTAYNPTQSKPASSKPTATIHK